MHRLEVVLVSLAAAAGIAGPPHEEEESGFRAELKCATDAGAKSISKVPKPTTIAEILALATPAGIDKGGDRSPSARKRFAPFETSIWQIEATLVQIQILEDDDLYFVLKDEKGRRLVCEIPGEEEVAMSPLRASIVSARKRLEDGLGPHRQPMILRQRIRVEGVGHFGSRGSKDNGAKLIPITKVTLIGKALPPN